MEVLSQVIFCFLRGKLLFPLIKVSSELLRWLVLYDFPFHTFVERANRKLTERKKKTSRGNNKLWKKIKINYYL